jgi:GxxExxY protein
MDHEIHEIHERKTKMEVLFKEECYRVMGACFEVYKEKGGGFLEAVYQECLEIELDLQGIPNQPHPELTLNYKGRQLQHTYVPDFICFGQIVVEIKAVSNFDNERRAQVHNYLRATSFRLGLLVNFGHHPQVEWERFVR